MQVVPHASGATCQWCHMPVVSHASGATCQWCHMPVVPHAIGAACQWCHMQLVIHDIEATCQWCTCQWCTWKWCHMRVVPHASEATCGWSRMPLAPLASGSTCHWSHMRVMSHASGATREWCHMPVMPHCRGVQPNINNTEPSRYTQGCSSSPWLKLSETRSSCWVNRLPKSKFYLLASFQVLSSFIFCVLQAMIELYCDWLIAELSAQNCCSYEQMDGEIRIALLQLRADGWRNTHSIAAVTSRWVAKSAQLLIIGNSKNLQAT